MQSSSFSRNPKMCSLRFLLSNAPNMTATSVLVHDFSITLKEWQMHVWNFATLRDSMYQDRVGKLFENVHVYHEYIEILTHSSLSPFPNSSLGFPLVSHFLKGSPHENLPCLGPSHVIPNFLAVTFESLVSGLLFLQKKVDRSSCWFTTFSKVGTIVCIGVLMIFGYCCCTR